MALMAMPRALMAVATTLMAAALGLMTADNSLMRKSATIVVPVAQTVCNRQSPTTTYLQDTCRQVLLLSRQCYLMPSCAEGEPNMDDSPGAAHREVLGSDV